MITITLNKFISYNHISVFHVEEDISDHSRQTTSFHHIFTKYLSNHEMSQHTEFVVTAEKASACSCLCLMRTLLDSCTLISLKLLPWALSVVIFGAVT